MESREISFVTWPDGKVDGGSLTVSGERIARERFVAAFLPPEWFGDFAARYVADNLWQRARDKGFKCHTIKITEDGAPYLDQ